MAAATIAAGAVVLRLILIFSGVGLRCLDRIEVSTPVNGLLQVREGASLLSIGTSPFQGSTTHVPPLVLWALAGIVQHPVWYAAPQAVADVIAAALVRDIVTGCGGRLQHVAARANGCMALYLLNPFSLMACVAGTVTPFENLMVVAAANAALHGNLLLAALCVACGTYIGLHPLLLLLPLGMLLVQSAAQRNGDTLLAAAKQQSTAADCSTASLAQTAGAEVNTDSAHGQQAAGCPDAQPVGVLEPRLEDVTITCCKLALATATLLLGLVAWSDALLSAFPEAQCIPQVTSHLPASLQRMTSFGAHAADVSASASYNCWATHVYSLQLLFQDLTPNIGQWWYFFAQVFPQQRAFFCFVAHALCALFAVPAALRFPRRGLLLLVLQVGISTMLRPYPSVGDLGLYLTLLLLLHRELAHVKSGLLLCNALLLLSVLGPAMWTQWIDAESANSNFYYSITLLLGAWHTLLFAQLLLASITSDLKR